MATSCGTRSTFFYLIHFAFPKLVLAFVSDGFPVPLCFNQILLKLFHFTVMFGDSRTVMIALQYPSECNALYTTGVNQTVGPKHQT